VCSEVLGVAAVVDRLERLLLCDEVAIEDVADSPVALTVLVVPLALADSPLTQAPGAANLSFDDLPRHDKPLYDETARSCPSRGDTPDPGH
jgi:hypothetical protein